ncbi:hypothetical protein HISP_00205 [Haloarcula hispanica N601]|uniref:Glycyl aminopeptidase n=2 Tax=Haloarcula hispanica TaxID=51589 RepID=V5THC0_HALHI|nr:hypothetical protein [Haloarcula hispanica]AEM55662.1 conserved hypothetical protein [Haloarcula hispanica ATCC 33960]AHB64493.1 hypothetical protein HISP_00205 [Haloarcula hispanica N601]MUV49115.1 hypothetical protein [Haloarcula sp. CBA1122]
MRTQMSAGLVCLLLVCTSPVALGVESSPPAQIGTSDSDSSIDVRYAIDREPTQTGRVRVTATIERPRHVTGLSVRTPAETTVLRADGLRSDGDRWRLSGDTRTAQLTYTVPVGLSTTFGQRTAGTDNWTLLARQEVSLRARWRWRAGPRPRWNESLVLAPGQNGVAGRTAAYIGPHETELRTVDGDRITLVVPAAADLRPNRTAVLDSISHAKRASTAGTDHDHIRVFVAPNELAPGGYSPSNGESDVIVNAGEPVRSPVNVWVHEYRHTRETFETTPAMDWLSEGSADYHTAALTYSASGIEKDQFHERITTERHETADLTQPDSWDGPGAQYHKGTRVVAAIDARLRQATDGNRTFEAVLDGLTRRDERITLRLFAETVSAVAGDDLDAFVRQAVTDTAPSVQTDALTDRDLQRSGVADTTDRQANFAPSVDSSPATATSGDDEGKHGVGTARPVTDRHGEWTMLGTLGILSVVLVGRQRRRKRL